MSKAKGRVGPLAAGCVGSVVRLAEACRVSRNTATKWTRLDGCPRESDGTWRIWDVCLWNAERERRRVGGQIDPGGDDEMLVAGSSPNLERFRGFRADREELELAEKRKSLMDVRKIEENLNGISKLIRDAGETLRRQYGDGAYAILGRALDQADIRIDEVFGTPDADEDDDEDPENDPQDEIAAELPA